MMASAAAQNLGLQTRVVSVGDKWIGNFPDGNKLVVGLEISGHVIFPIPVQDIHGNTQTLLSGIGIVTGLMTLAAVKSLNLPESRILEPFKPGFSKTFYVYFVDKTKHFRGSSIWNKDITLVQTAIHAAKEAGQLPPDTEIVLEEKEDPHVLYMNIMSSDKLLGVLFIRNSGTEDKNATYVKGDVAFENALVPIGQQVQVMHMKEMKNKFCIEYTYERLVMEQLAKGDSTVDALISTILAAGEHVTETDLFSVLHGLKKEGRVIVEGRDVRLHLRETKVWPLMGEKEP